jgi:hypothetical protein
MGIVKVSGQKLNLSPEEEAKLKAANQSFIQGMGAKNQRRGMGDLAAGHAGTAVQNAMSALVPAQGGDGVNALADTALNAAGAMMGGVAEGVSTGLKTLSDQSAANEAAGYAGAMRDAQNDRARADLMGQAGQAARDMNLQNAAQGAAMTDSAIANQGAYDMGMQSIGMSGIEGSANMERNLQYGMDRADAEQRLQYEIMGNGAEDLSNSLAQSFGDLSQGKAAATQGAWSDSMTQAGQANAAQWAAQSAAEHKFSLESMAELDRANNEAAFAAGVNDAQGQNGPDSEYETAAGGQNGPDSEYEAAGEPETAQPGDPPEEPKAKINPDDLISFYSQPKSTAQSLAKLKTAGMTEDDIAEFDKIMGEFNKSPNREARIARTRQFLAEKGYM